ncbi:phage tail sheath family protein [Corallococcus aberystwythensis]|uniref:Phage tail protein n=1 Tax=Corallococcus aberystwythensis TaxID=2316722 RepID=A0A3A8PT35_9BACT|nr:phage tail sheath C-terminal domain-containing protein [Corallococcus aberystwythensis]RKH59553.1 phage tail protein [Corallococcus aberystwythensis]
MSTEKTPDVYIKEVSLLPPSVAEVATAIPAFIGYTKKAERNGVSLTKQPFRIKSQLEFEQYFGGGASPKSVTVKLDDDNAVLATAITPRFYLYDSLRLFFDNGGGPCYIISVGSYSDTVDKAALVAGLEPLRKEDEPTLIVIPEAVLLSDNDCSELQTKMLAQCEELQDRFAILDVMHDAAKTLTEMASTFRNGIGMRALRYGAAYFPYVRTTTPFTIRYKDITFEKGGNTVGLASLTGTAGSLLQMVQQLDRALKDVQTLKTALADAEGSGKTYPKHFQPAQNELETRAELVHYATVLRQLALRLLGYATGLNSSQLQTEALNLVKPAARLEALVEQLKGYDLAFNGIVAGATALGIIVDTDFPSYSLPAAATPEHRAIYGATPANVAAAVAHARPAFRAAFEEMYALLTTLQESADRIVDNLEEIVRTTHPVLQRAFEALGREAAVLPPSGAIAGLYAYVDNSRGVWKAPANVSLSSVVEPVLKLDANDQANLNVDVDAGKSINAIRAFAGKGTLVWGARTLAGNDNEWRYISVRRFYNMVEESIKKSTYWAVFEPNDPNTWVRVRSMIENYLTQRWRDGALTGAKPDEAFFVKLGLGVTMTPQDVLEGRMNVEIGLAVVRPAEFIVLKFSHKMQTA